MDLEKKLFELKAMPKLGSEGYVIEPMDVNEKLENNVIIDGEAYHAWALEALTAYCRVTVVGYDEAFKFLKLKLQLLIRVKSVT